jgi:hypothetical protein
MPSRRMGGQSSREDHEPIIPRGADTIAPDARLVASTVLGWHHGGVEPDDLYGLPLDRFVPERGALARSLRADGRREQAAAVASLRKPSIVAWAVNQLVRTQGRALAELCDAGDRLREAQAGVLAGRGDARSLHAAADRERVAVDALVIAARGLLTSEGHELSASTIDRVAETVHAAALDDDARAQVRQGRLERELRHVGLGVDAAGASPPAPASMSAPVVRRPARAKPRAPKAVAGERDSTEQRDRERIAQERAAARRVERERAEARREARVNESEARRSADHAARAVRVAEQRRERAVDALRDAEQALVEARTQAEAAEDRHRRAEHELGSL